MRWAARANGLRLLITSPGGVSEVQRRNDELLVEAGIDASVGSVGDAYDNALAESQIGLYKAELIHRHGPWRDRDHVEAGTLDWVEWFNTERPHESIDDLTPVAAEHLHYRYRARLAEAG